MLLKPSVQVKAIESHTFVAYRYFWHKRPHVALEHFLAHAQVGRCFAVANDAGSDHSAPTLGSHLSRSTNGS